MDQASSNELLLSLINHIVLPPRIPAKEDHDSVVNQELTRRLIQAAQSIRDYANQESLLEWEQLLSGLKASQALNSESHLDKATLIDRLTVLSPGTFLVLHVSNQNAGILNYRQACSATEPEAIFEVFEASPSSEAVLASENALEWDFPGSTVAIPNSVFVSKSFQESIATFLDRASSESMSQFASTTTKAGSRTIESRDTADPALISQFLVTVLEAAGRPVSQSTFRKRIRDEVSWTSGSELPWRRSPLWLVLRVGVQSRLQKVHGLEQGRFRYKLLVAVVVAQLLRDATGSMEPGLIALLKAKLGRRLTKLEILQQKIVDDPKNSRMFQTLGNFFEKILERSSEYIDFEWSAFKQRIQRPIHRLPSQARDNDMVLSLPSSGPHLDLVMAWNAQLYSMPHVLRSVGVPNGYDPYGSSTDQVGIFTNRYFELAQFEETLNNRYWQPLGSINLQHTTRDISDYLQQISVAYDSDPEQKSTMILHLMRMWCHMDQAATDEYHMILDYHPGFSAGMLDVLHLNNLYDMETLQSIQTHLQRRYDGCGPTRTTLFDDPSPECFAVRHFDHSPNLRTLLSSLEAAAERDRAAKEREWRQITSEVESLEAEIAAETCLRTTTSDEDEHFRRCRRCFLKRNRRRMRIEIFEYPLPSNVSQKKALVFELDPPHNFRLYRATTWAILHFLGQHGQWKRHESPILLSNSTFLRSYLKSPDRVSLASTTKPFEKTHYGKLKLPVALNEVCYPCGLTLKYFDTKEYLWTTSRSSTLTITHHLRILAPLRTLLFPSSDIDLEASLATQRLSSYNVMANQSHCPPGMNIHEFIAIHQALVAGDEQRWLNLLIELGSSNLNFSTEAVRILVETLSSRAGSAHNSDSLRKAHRVFRDQEFCDRLGQLVRQKLDSISSNWREINCMDIVITLILRICAFASEARDLLQASRDATYHWVATLNAEINTSADAESVQSLAGYIVTASILYRKTFSTFSWSSSAENPGLLIGSNELSRWIEVSIIFRNNMPAEPDALPVVLRNALARDSKLVVHIKKILRDSLVANMDGFAVAINRMLSQPDEAHPITDILSVPDSWWIQATAHATESMREQKYFYNLVEGYFLVDGKPLGQLPAEYRESDVLRDLFGNQNLLTIPSSLYGMMYKVAYSHHGHQVHFGFRDGLLFVRALYSKALLEFVPQQHFVSKTREYDIPAPLVDGCVHWLNVVTGELEVRVRPDVWRTKKNNWRINLGSRRATRDSRTFSTLVNPSSHLFRRVATTFAYFEDAKHLLVSQSCLAGRLPTLRVELRRLELTFSVNQNGLLQSRQLRSEIDPNQDAGTWYGLMSSLVLRNVANHSRRVALVSLGSLKYVRKDFHVAVYVQSSGKYGCFTINETLGRVECPPEPLLVYSKAMFHAFTSFVIPDPLTGRTGTEEAFHCLKSGSSSPWTSLNEGPIDVLSTIATLVPFRAYYPKNLKVLEQVTWDPNLPHTIQHDGFLPILNAILAKTRMLVLFSPSSVKIPVVSSTETHLAVRALQRRSLSERPWESKNARHAPDTPYQSRHHRRSSPARRNAFEVTMLLVLRPATMQTLTSISLIMTSWKDVGGFSQPFASPFLSDVLNASLDREWGSFVRLCHRSDADQDTFELVFVLALLAFRDDISMDLVRALVAFAIYPEFKELDLPQAPSFVQFRYRLGPSVDVLLPFLRPHTIAYVPQDDEDLGHLANAQTRQRIANARKAHERDVKTESEAVARCFLEQWPCEMPSILEFPAFRLLNLPKALDSIYPEWHRLFQNLQLSIFIDLVEDRLCSRRSDRAISVPGIPPLVQNASRTQVATSWRPSLSELLSHAPMHDYSQPLIRNRGLDSSVAVHHNEPKSQAVPAHPPSVQKPSDRVPQELLELHDVVRHLGQSKSVIKKNYAASLMSSVESLRHKSTESDAGIRSADDDAEIVQSLHASLSRLHDHFRCLTQSLEENDARCRWLKLGGIWPAVTPVALLEELRSIVPTSYDMGVKEALTAYGISMTETQRLVRIKDSHLQRNTLRLEQDRINLGHANWNPLDHPDWLLFEIDANLLLRPKQTDVATATIWPPSEENSVLQMNMGEGKTSCIMILCAANLANFDQLARIVVPKALLLQTAQLLQSRLGGLLGRSLTHIPWSRKTLTDAATVEAYRHFHFETKDNAGVLISLPEHLLSFMLSGQQRLSDGRITEAQPMIHFQNWLQRTCRDVLDECDHTLAVRTQLIYPSGSQTAVDGHPHRWETSEELLKLVESHLESLSKEFPLSLDVFRVGGFPVIHFLRENVEDALLERLVRDVLQDRIPQLPTLALDSEDQETVRRYLSDPLVSVETSQRAQTIYKSQPIAMQNLYLVRGLLAHRILLLTLKKRWNVQYGLHPHRSPVAVPYHAKGVPSDQAEWGHPDVAILFTCLSFYYGGLRFHELKQSLEHIAKSDDPAGEFERWHHRSMALSDPLRDWNAINIEDAQQLNELWMHVRHEVTIIDYYLNHFVFPKFAKQFRTKLQSSGWDLPLFLPPVAGIRDASDTRCQPLTTGFSGTNDNRTLLPLTIQQRDLPALAHTNAEVLTYLLQKRNRRAIATVNADGSRLTERDLLHLLHREHIRVLIDAGAMILEMDNATLAAEWLKIDWKAPAAVYFDENNKPMVMSRSSGTHLPLVATPYAENLGEALIYLDQSHTRGTDLNIPSNAIGALTLGLTQTKDATVQAAMRLRRLATTQSIVFLMPPEVHQSILDLQGTTSGSVTDSRDVIRWLLEQTCIGLEQLQPLYYAQGLDFCQRSQSAIENSELLSSSKQCALYLAKLRRDELQTLERMYKPKKREKSVIKAEDFVPSIREFIIKLVAIRRGFEDSNYVAHASALEEVEQEREVAFEVESVREVQRPLCFEPLQFPGLHPDLIQFLENGTIIPDSDGYEPAFTAMAKTALSQRKKVRSETMTMPIFASKELSRTVKLTTGRPNDDFIRPVNWILFGRQTDTAIMINPEEAEAAIPIIRNIPKPVTHLLLYSAPVVRRMMHFNYLAYYALPSMPAEWRAPKWLRIELGLFAGRLYFDFEEYEDVTRSLGLHSTDKIARHVEGTGTPLLFVQEWLSIRRKGQDFTHTPMGAICRGKSLTASHPAFARPEKRTSVSQSP